MKLIANILGSIAITLILLYFYSKFLKSTKLGYKKITLIYAVDCIYCLIYTTITSTPIERSCCFIIFIIFPILFYTDKLSKKVVFTIIFYATVSLTELVTKAILIGYNGIFSTFYHSYEYHYFLGFMLSKMLAFIIIYCYTFVLSVKENKVPIWLYIFLLFVPFSSIVIYYFLQNIVLEINKQSVYIAHCYITFTLLLINLIVFILFSRVTETSWLKAKLTYEKQIILEQQQYYKNLTNYYEKIRQLYHDMQHHFLILYQEISQQNQNAALQYLQKQLNYLTENQMVYCGYSLLDTAFDYKKQLAFQQQTKFIVYSELNTDLSLSEELLIDLSIILASCLDNALEATLKIPQKDNRWIKIFLENDANYIYFQIENPVHQTITINDSQIPITTKENHLIHGLGLRNVKNLINRHYGELFLDCTTNNIFTTGGMLKY